MWMIRGQGDKVRVARGGKKGRGTQIGHGDTRTRGQGEGGEGRKKGARDGNRGEGRKKGTRDGNRGEGRKKGRGAQIGHGDTRTRGQGEGARGGKKRVLS
jgi:hypothetical protein